MGLKRRVIYGLLLCMFAATAVADALSVTDARLRLLPGDLPVAGYFRLINEGDDSVVLSGAESSAFEHVTMHQSTQVDGMAGMEPVPELELAPDGAIEFLPGGYHLMLMKRRSPIEFGAEVPVTLIFADGQRLSVQFQAVSPAAM
ncbi:copper chaperone PCu(A)C [Saccharospirillum sp.]|uniref:copper chaperone PCu(A)C n=1 Tax=Saccharospirillum sp. TaxID=2033801 RepID=UPI0034A077BA